MGSKKAQPKTVAPAVPKKAVAKTPWRRHLLALAALWTLALVAYASSFSAGLVFDNRLLILNDARVRAATSQNVGLILDHDYWYGNQSSQLYRPLTTLSYLFNYAVLGDGPNPAGYHWVNFALHAINIALVYFLALALLGGTLGELPIALAMAAIWAVHPVLTESVTNVVGRADLLAAFGVLAALLCHIRAIRASGSLRTRWLLGIALATAVGVFSKESAIVAPAVLLLYDLAFESPRAWRTRIANYAAAILPCLLYLSVRSQVLAKSLNTLIPFVDNPLTAADFWTARLTALRVIGKYIGLLIWPGTLSADYSYNEIPLFRAGHPAALAGVAVCLALAAAGIWAFRRNKPIFFFIMLFFVTLAPVSNVFLLIGTIMAERFLYLPALAFAGCVAIGLRAIPRRLPASVAPVLLAALCAIFVIRTYIRNLDWASEQSIMASAAAAAPGGWRPHANLANVLTGRAGVAEADQARAILDPLPDDENNMIPYNGIGVCYRTEGDRVAPQNPQEAQAWYRKSLDALLRARSIERVYDQMNQAENRRRGIAKSSFAWDEVYLELGRTYLKLSQPSEALEAFQQGRRRSTQPEVFSVQASAAYHAVGDSQQAAVELIVASILNGRQPNSPAVEAYRRRLSGALADLYRQTEPFSCAVREAGGVRSIDMECPLVKQQMCAGWRELGRDYGMKGMPPACAAE